MTQHKCSYKVPISETCHNVLWISTVERSQSRWLRAGQRRLDLQQTLLDCQESSYSTIPEGPKYPTMK